MSADVKMIRGAWAEVDLKAFSSNVKTLAEKVRSNVDDVILNHPRPSQVAPNEFWAVVKVTLYFFMHKLDAA